MSLDQLIIKCKKGNARAQGDLYNLYSRKLFSLCLKYSRNYAEAEDSLQDAFLTIFRKIGQFKNKGSFEGWMKRIVINTALQKYRKQGYLDVVNENQIEAVTVDVDELEDLPALRVGLRIDIRLGHVDVRRRACLLCRRHGDELGSVGDLDGLH